MRRQLSLILVAALAACVASPPALEYLDAQTAATVTVAKQGWIFALDRPDLAVNAQDYVTVTPVQTNRNGQRTIYLYCQVWSTIDRLGDAAVVPKNAELALIADDRRVPLPKQSADLRKLGFGKYPVASPNKAAEVRALAIDADLLGFIVKANQVRISLRNGDDVEHFTTWRDGRSAAADFLNHIATKR